MPPFRFGQAAGRADVRGEEQRGECFPGGPLRPECRWQAGGILGSRTNAARMLISAGPACGLRRQGRLDHDDLLWPTAVMTVLMADRFLLNGGRMYALGSLRKRPHPAHQREYQKRGHGSCAHCLIEHGKFGAEGL